MSSPQNRRQIAIYTRYSCDMQRPDSCVDQERKVRQELQRLGIDDSAAIVLKDEAWKGSLEDRPSYSKLKEMIYAENISILIVDELSRLSRGNMLVALIEDMQFHGTRLIAVHDGLDTNNRDWKVNATFKQMMNSASNDATAWRVRRGQEGRVRDSNGSAGDWPIGYRSEYVDSDWQEQISRGRKPKKRIVIDDQSAATVRQIFDMYVNQGISVSAIVKKFNETHTPKSRRSHCERWTTTHIRTILKSPKYKGEWAWGVAENIRDSKGQVRRRPTKQDKQVHQYRPNLQIVTKETWDKAQAIMAERSKHFRWKFTSGDKTYVHPKHMFPKTNLAGLIRCGQCGTTIGTARAKKGRVYKCRHAMDHDNCDMNKVVHADWVDQKIYSIIADYCRNTSGWMDQVKAEMINQLRATAQVAPNELMTLKQHESELNDRIKNLLDKLASITGDAPALTQLYEKLEAERAELVERRAKVEAVANIQLEIPDNHWIEERLKDLPAYLAKRTPEAIRAIREIVEDAVIEDVFPGKHGAPVRIRVKINPAAIVMSAFDETTRNRIVGSISKGQSIEHVEIIARPTKFRELGPKIEELRNAHLTWVEIAAKLNISRTYAIQILRNWKAAKVAQ